MKEYSDILFAHPSQINTPTSATAQTKHIHKHRAFLFQMLVLHAEAFIVVMVEVLDALMNHLEEALEAVLSRGENLTLDNKVGKQTSNSLTCVNYTPLVLLRSFLFLCGTSLILLSNLGSLVSSHSSGSSTFSSGSSSVPGAAVGSAVSRAEGWMFSALAAA